MDMRDTVLDVLFRRDSFQPKQLRNFYKDKNKKSQANFKEKMFSFMIKGKPSVDPENSLGEEFKEEDKPVVIEMGQLGEEP